MANEEHLARLKQGVEAWNTWRDNNHEVQPHLEEAHLARVFLREVNLSKADLSGADLHQVSITARECPVIVGDSAQRIAGNAAHSDRWLSCITGW
jgi:uncharacterized protein YjbI with pentapeptide repeats